jgi:hypothetical protein
MRVLPIDGFARPANATFAIEGADPRNLSNRKMLPQFPHEAMYLISAELCAGMNLAVRTSNPLATSAQHSMDCRKEVRTDVLFVIADLS